MPEIQIVGTDKSVNEEELVELAALAVPLDAPLGGEIFIKIGARLFQLYRAMTFFTQEDLDKLIAKKREVVLFQPKSLNEKRTALQSSVLDLSKAKTRKDQLTGRQKLIHQLEGDEFSLLDVVIAFQKSFLGVSVQSLRSFYNHSHLFYNRALLMSALSVYFLLKLGVRDYLILRDFYHCLFFLQAQSIQNMPGHTEQESFTSLLNDLLGGQTSESTQSTLEGLSNDLPVALEVSKALSYKFSRFATLYQGILRQWEFPNGKGPAIGLTYSELNDYDLCVVFLNSYCPHDIQELLGIPFTQFLKEHIFSEQIESACQEVGLDRFYRKVQFLVSDQAVPIEDAA